MRRATGGRLILAALFLSSAAQAEPVLQVTLAEGDVLGALPLPEGREACLHWAHSVTGGAVADCFENRDGQLVLVRSYLHDFAAGLGETAGRGHLVSAKGGGYWIEDIDAPMTANALDLRIGALAVDHRLSAGGETLALSRLAPSQRAQLSLIFPHTDGPGEP